MNSARETFIDGALYVVATPIGNLADVTVRALAGFHAADIILAEDTRVTGSLLTAYGIHKKLVSLREHNEREMAANVVRWIGEGKIVLQVSDAGTPGISDPGARLADAVWAAGLRVVPIVGASAVIGAMSAAGLETGQFHFHGFLPPKSGARSKTLQQWQQADYAVVCYEAPHRILECVEDIVATLGEARPLVLARELTKTFETFLRLPAGELAARIRADSNQQRGECVLIIDAAPRVAAADDALPAAAQALLAELVAVLPTKQAATIVAGHYDLNKKQLYDAALQLKAVQ
ncbi:16S rRNA (cytidine(1402)-2'-O)-methyltransferase [Vogesella sp. LIG4]|uniref:16S rRNA (cytidine(1402)-2'-O)-methyltransferase n=1 Tax=Vogesella sp. LIG4 TaxID=1192162 RepID=UPI00081FE52C|nr:16S rRNA (cytidine(1402)-2'-O)-methyltransferase [Vogesella sp. LIG4]SCK14140.1 16S rRNA (cytidine1402-2'-O)-methyltransferase [Vogesella sp. LIG4]